jgi:hypothetical protein
LVGILLLLIFVVIGVAASNRIFSEEKMYLRVWAGGVIGILGLMWFVVPFAFFFGFSVLSHILATILMLGFYILVRKLYKQEGSLTFNKEKDNFCLYALVVIISGLSIYLLNGHILAPGADGGLYAGQSTYGDLSLHLGIITSIASQHTFPPDYSIFPGTLLSYPFLADSMSSSLYLFGTSLRWAVLIPSYVMVVLLVSGFFIFTYEILKNKFAAIFSTILFFFNGGFGFAYFMDGLMKDPNNFLRIFTAWYNTPTNYNDHFIRWSNTICDMIIPQRTTLAGWTVLMFALWLLYRAVHRESGRYFVYTGIVASLLPMIHTHSFLAFGIISAVWFVVYFFKPGKNVKSIKPVKAVKKKISNNDDGYIMKWVLFSVLLILIIFPGFVSRNLVRISIVTILGLAAYAFYYCIEYKNKEDVFSYIKKWCYFGIPILLFAVPQLLFWTLRQAGGSGFTGMQAGWKSNTGDIWPWFWIKNIGLVFILLFPAILAAKKRMLSIYSGALAIFAISNLILFQPNDYDNNKLLYIWFIFTIVIVVEYLYNIYKRLEGMYGRGLVIGILLIVCTLSGILTIGREVNSNKEYLLFDSNAVKAADFVKAKTPKDALFISADQHLNPVTALAGRDTFSGAGIYLYFHGINKTDRDTIVDKMYKDSGSFNSLAQQNKIDYVYYSNYERDKFKVEPTFFEKNYPKVFHQGDIYIFAVSARAKAMK